MSDIHARLVSHLNHRSINYLAFDHPETYTSAESEAARRAAGAPPSIGAKALLIKATKLKSFCVIVLPAHNQLNAKRLKSIFGNTRFAKPEEFTDLTGGLRPGSLPPFAAPVAPTIERLYIDEKLFEFETLAFNAAKLTTSFVMPSREYRRAVDGLYTMLFGNADMASA